MGVRALLISKAGAGVRSGRFRADTKQECKVQPFSLISHRGPIIITDIHGS